MNKSASGIKGWRQVEPVSLSPSEIAKLGFFGWLASLTIGGFLSLFALAIVSPGPGQQGVILLFDLGAVIFGGLAVLFIGTNLATSALKSGNFGFLQAQASVFFLFWVSTYLVSYLAVQDVPFAAAYAFHCAAMYGPIAVLVFWELLVRRHPELSPSATGATSALRIASAFAAVLSGHLLLGIVVV